MPGVYALISPDGSLRFREGVPGRMLEDTGSRRPPPTTAMLNGSWFTILRAQWGAQGLCGHADGGPGAPNRVGQRLLVALGGTDPELSGNLTICGTEVAQGSGDTALCGLNPAQQRLIEAAHGRARQEERESG